MPLSFEIFTSYSHCDARFVKPLIQYLLPTGSSVFLDKEAIIPGKKWALVISEAIEGCRVMYVFWCSHSASSLEVQKEYEYAISLNKDIVPVLLDNKPLPISLKEYQWIDLRDVIGQHEKVIKQSIPVKEALERQRLDRGKHEYGIGQDGIHGGDFWRQGYND